MDTWDDGCLPLDYSEPPDDWCGWIADAEAGAPPTAHWFVAGVTGPEADAWVEGAAVALLPVSARALALERLRSGLVEGGAPRRIVRAFVADLRRELRRLDAIELRRERILREAQIPAGLTDSERQFAEAEAILAALTSGRR